MDFENPSRALSTVVNLVEIESFSISAEYVYIKIYRYQRAHKTDISSDISTSTLFRVTVLTLSYNIFERVRFVWIYYKTKIPRYIFHRIQLHKSVLCIICFKSCIWKRFQFQIPFRVICLLSFKMNPTLIVGCSITLLLATTFNFTFTAFNTLSLCFVWNIQELWKKKWF